MVLTRGAAKALAMKEGGIKEEQKSSERLNEEKNPGDGTSTGRCKVGSKEADKKLKSSSRRGDRCTNCSSKKLQPPSKCPLSKELGNPLEGVSEARSVVEDLIDVARKSTNAPSKAIRRVSKMSTAQSYRARRYKVIRGASVQNMESNKSRFDPRENFLRTLPNRVKVVLPCGVIKSIAEKLQQVEDDTTLIEIFVFSSDIYQSRRRLQKGMLCKR
uniref:Uncharacterized protein n=1 Tax=Parascaris univalens TaxID=6257 RepID=A0A915A8S9_PARUN